MKNASETRISCPYCSEKIVASAKKCRFCGEWIVKEETTQTVEKKAIHLPKFVKIILIILVFLVVISLIPSKSNNTQPENNTAAVGDETSLRNFINEQYKLVSSDKKEDWSKLYREFYSPEHEIKKQTEEAFVTSQQKQRENGLDHYEFEIHSIKINGTNGFVDRTQKACANSDCSKTLGVNRGIRKYVFYQGKWLMTDNKILCSREEPYTISPEFERVFSLILQRSEDYKTDFEDIKNCVLIRYATSEKEMLGAEGLFSFFPGQSSDKLEILVSPRYKVKDDLTTAILIVHELTHASDYVTDLIYNQKTDCFTSEARAFQNQNWFISILNSEEKASIDARLNTGASEELKSIKYYWNAIDNIKGDTIEERWLKFIKSLPYYQEQCKGE